MRSRDNTVLSLSSNPEKLLRREEALVENGFMVISVSSPVQARYELEMGRCGIFLTCSITPPLIYRDLASLFRRNCPEGLIVFVAQDDDKFAHDADITVPEQTEPASIVAALRGKRQESHAD